MRTVDDILRELHTDNPRNIRIIAGHVGLATNMEDAIENARETAGDLAATTEARETPHALRRGNTIPVGLHEAEALVAAGASDDVGLQELTRFPLS
jgi:hypothetical protein